MNKYGQVALKATTLAINGMHPVQAWELAATETFIDSPSAQKKSCPKSVFLGLAQAGLLKGVAPGQYTKSRNNYQYALAALALLKQDESLSQNPKKLWSHVTKKEIKVTYNSQMDVVLALWNTKYLVEEPHCYL